LFGELIPLQSSKKRITRGKLGNELVCKGKRGGSQGEKQKRLALSLRRSAIKTFREMRPVAEKKSLE
jgi:hypothetical protein